MTEKIELSIDQLVEKKFRDIKLETKIVSYLLRRDFYCKNLLEEKYFTIEPYQMILRLIQKYKMSFSKDILCSYLKKEVDSGKFNIYEVYIDKVYEDNLDNVEKETIKVLINDLKKLWESRNIFNSLSEIISGDLEKFNLEKAKNILKKTIYESVKRDKKFQGEYLEDAADRISLIKDRQENPQLIISIPTGIIEFDKVSGGGLQKGEFGIVVADTGLGKSIILMNFLVNAWKRNFNTLFVSLEMTKEQIEFRIDSRITKIFHSEFRKASLTKDELNLWESKMGNLKEKKKNFMEILYMPRGCCCQEIEEEAYRIQSKREKKIDLIVIDYLNLMASNKERWNNSREWKNQGEVAWDIKQLVSEFNDEGTIIWTANQLTDEGAKSKKLGTHHLKYSRAISEVCPVILALTQSVEDLLCDVMKLWALKVRDFARLKTPILLHPKFEVMNINIDSTEVR